VTNSEFNPLSQGLKTMKYTRTMKIMAILVCCYFLLWVPIYFWPAYLDSPFGLLIVLPYFSLYLLHGLGIPGLLEHNGACGWGWCSPSLLGWLVLSILGCFITWLLARVIVTITSKN
jgi:hypothetical protein